MDVSQYLGIFLDETNEHLQTLSDQLMILENEPENEDTINEIFRAAHSLKGMAGTMGYKRMQNLTHDMENVFSEVRNGKIKVDGHMVDILFQALDALEEYRENISENQDEGTNENEPIIKELQAILNGDGASDKSDAKASGKKEEKADSSEETATGSESGSSGEEGKWCDIVIHEPEQHVIAEAIKNNSKVYGLTVYIQESCILKAARAFLVFKALEEMGEVIVSEPSVQDIEDEKFDFDFSLYFVTDAEIDKVKEAVMSVSEIDHVVADVIDMDKAKIANEDDEEESASAPAAEHTESTAPAPAEAASSNAPAPASKDTKGTDSKKGGNKPAVNRTVRVDIEKLDVLMNLVSELIIAKNSLVSFATSENNGAHTGFNEQIEYLESVTTNLHESVMKVRMVPIESVVNKFPRMIRDLSKKLNKQMELHMSGEETELDRTVVDEIGDPLMHLLRNSADHGLEGLDVRRERGKSDVGQIYLDAYQDGNNVVIEVRDDGNGIDTEAVKKKGIERGIITPEQGETMSEKDIIDLLFLPSFSTAKVVSDVSGRGVGLDVVRSKIGALGGDVSVKTKLGEGSTWTIRLPLTLAIIQALMVVVGGEKYAISLGSIQTIEDVAEDEIKYVEAREVINLRDTVIPIIRLRDVLGVEKEQEKSANMVVIIVKKGDQLAGLVVDELIGQQEIVIKSLGKYINCSSHLISGATILGDGEVALILDANVLI